MVFHLTEPHPSVPSTSYIHSGRGGAGNVVHVPANSTTPSTTASGPAARIPLPAPPANERFAAGRGGFGNMHTNSERAIFSFDEELERQRAIAGREAPVFHIGRGGAGNAVDDHPRPRSGRLNSIDSTASRDSDDSGAGARARRSIDGVLDRLSHTFSRN
ncbi:MAG: hypothetical protein M1819_006515 [Sarea resinae]|nr:MAG: hypothetical protein M1819_000607 [Sarea resinae]KAI9828808.1 MAG: hypothetical protein M1819_006515 [Sarea resinae]